MKKLIVIIVLIMTLSLAAFSYGTKGHNTDPSHNGYNESHQTIEDANHKNQHFNGYKQIMHEIYTANQNIMNRHTHGRVYNHDAKNYKQIMNEIHGTNQNLMSRHMHENASSRCH